MRPALKWSIAVLASGLVHAGAAAYLLAERPEQVEIAGSAAMEIALLGSFEEAFAAGEPAPDSETVEPVGTPDEAVQPRPAPETDMRETPAEAVEPVQAEPPPAEVTEPLAPQTPQPAQVLVPAEAVAPVERSAEAEPVEAATTAPEPAAETEPVETARARITPVKTAEALAPVEEIVIPDDVPLPTARPQPPKIWQAMVRPEKPRAREAPRKKAETPPKQRRKTQAAGQGGRAEQSTRRGEATGNERGRATAQGTGSRKQGAAGNAAVSNYPGKVARKLRRALRGVSRAARRDARRDVHVHFVVTRNGGLGSVRITQSSGSATLDKAALASVRRAAPFPPIPAAAGRSSWKFSVPLGLAR
ncbi:MAG: TonB family protein [Nitratireductor sp.]